MTVWYHPTRQAPQGTPPPSDATICTNDDSTDEDKLDNDKDGSLVHACVIYYPILGSGLVLKISILPSAHFERLKVSNLSGLQAKAKLNRRRLPTWIFHRLTLSCIGAS
jgi:hypothetical protein